MNFRYFFFLNAIVFGWMALPLSAADAAPDLTGVAIGASAIRYGASFATGDNGAPAVSYFKGDRKLYYVWFSENGWQEELVEGPVIGLGGRNFSQLIFVNGAAHIVYLDSSFERLKHAWRNSAGTWTAEIVDSN